jgi:hypothetical protein
VDVWVETGEITGVPEGLADLSAIAALAGALPEIGGILFKAKESGPQGAVDPRAVRAQLGRGAALDSSVRTRMESAFGRSFSDVRVHADRTGAHLSNRFNARAFTVGRHMAFDTNEYRPGTFVGDALIAHELAHVAQQESTVSGSAAAQNPIGAERLALEMDADRTAGGVLASIWARWRGGGNQRVPQLTTGLSLQRCSRCKDPKGICKVKNGPRYLPAGPIDAAASTDTGGAFVGPLSEFGGETACFAMLASFETNPAGKPSADPTKDVNPACCEVHQYVWSTKGSSIAGLAPAWSPKEKYPPEQWFEDRDDENKRYGHRADEYSSCSARQQGFGHCPTIDKYLNSTDADTDCQCGDVFQGQDSPTHFCSKEYTKFKLKVFDRCNGTYVEGKEVELVVRWGKGTKKEACAGGAPKK